ncbi:MAG: HAD-IA family hydrolase [Oscillospiraceae bacterium]|nr:HAD-IA family hydrolase [Oscillospiraceae bacterium]
MDFKHIIWDFDGTLFDTYPHTARAFQVTLKREYGVQENLGEIESQMRISMQTAFDFYKEKYETDDYFCKSFKEFQIIYENQNALPHINAHMICRFIHEQEAFNYLFTHRDKSVVSLMQKHGFYELFREIITKENGFPRKPAPDGLNQLIKKYKMNKNETLYIGDREIDLKCAERAGVRFCLFARDINFTLNADFRVQNFSDLYYIINSTLSTRKKQH